MMAAHDLHQEVRQWSSKDNDIIAAAKKMAFLMARLSRSVQEEEGSKRELISISKVSKREMLCSRLIFNIIQLLLDSLLQEIIILMMTHPSVEIYC